VNLPENAKKPKNWFSLPGGTSRAIKDLLADWLGPEKSPTIIPATQKTVLLVATKARREATKAGVRIASMPKVTEFSFSEGGLTADYRRVKELTEIMAKKLENVKKVRITSDNGTDFTASIGGREWVKDDGMIHEKGNFCNLPAGEAAVAPPPTTMAAQPCKQITIIKTRLNRLKIMSVFSSFLSK